ncbi:MAG: hypothetical protein HQK53_02870 [Oligoflexia bacterium]|nr:hypothetical protein [Oligoflexia bacterium]
MFYLIKLAVIVGSCFIIFSIPINNKTLFSYLEKESAPLTTSLINKTKETTQNTYRKTKQLAKQLFRNSIPKSMQKIRNKSENDEASEDTKKVDKYEITKLFSE